MQAMTLTQTNLKRLPQFYPERRECIGACSYSREGCLGQTGLGKANFVQIPSLSGAGDVRLLFKDDFPSKWKGNPLICLPSTLKNKYDERKAKRRKRVREAKSKEHWEGYLCSKTVSLACVLLPRPQKPPGKS